MATDHPSIKFTLHEGKWWCQHFGVTGCGLTKDEAEADMWSLYREATTPPIRLYPTPSRA